MHKVGTVPTFALQYGVTHLPIFRIGNPVKAFYLLLDFMGRSRATVPENNRFITPPPNMIINEGHALNLDLLKLVLYDMRHNDVFKEKPERT